MNLWDVTIRYQHNPGMAPSTSTYSVTAATIDVAVRKASRLAKRDGHIRRTVTAAELVREIDR